MTVTLPLELAEWSRKSGNISTAAPVQARTVVQAASTSRGQKSRSAQKATSKRKGASAQTGSDSARPIYEQFGNLSSNPTYHLARVGEAIRQARNVIVISGAGVSTPAIPDFRSSRGLFKTLADETRRRAMFSESDSKDQGLNDCERDVEQADGSDTQGGPDQQRKPRGRAVATNSSSAPSLGGMKSGKELFDVKCLTSPDLLPHHHNLLNHLTFLTSRTSPTPFHHYLKTLDDEGRLLRCYTQNIDGLEEKAGLDLRIPLEEDFPKRRRTGMSRESSRKSDVFGKNAKENPAQPQPQPQLEDQNLNLSPVQTSTSQGPIPADVPVMIGPTPEYYNPYQNPRSQQSHLLPPYPQIVSYRPNHLQPQSQQHHSTSGQFLNGEKASDVLDSASVILERPYPADSDAFCDSYQATTSTDSARAEHCQLQFPSAIGTLDNQQLHSGSGFATVRAGSVARSVSGTTDTSATSVSAKVEGGRDTDNDRDTDREAAETTPRVVGITESLVELPASESQSGPVNMPKLPRCVPLHGTLANLECTRCSHSQPLRDSLPLPLELMPCPSCEDAWDERVESSQRPRSIGFLRASVLLYGEEHKHGESIGAVVERDLLGRLKDERMDLLIVAGTTLQIPGVKRMIKEFAKALRTQAANKKKPSRKNTAGDHGSDEKEVSTAALSRSRTTTSVEADNEDEDEDFPIQTILLNRDPPSKGKGGEWANTFDVWVQGDLQEFVQQWVVEGPPSGEIQKLSNKFLDTAIPSTVLSPNRNMRIVATKVEGTKIHLSLEKYSGSATGNLPSQRKRKQPPSPVKTVPKAEAKVPKKSKGQSVIPFASKKAGASKKASVKASPARRQPSSPDTNSSRSDDLCVLIEFPERGSISALAATPQSGRHVDAQLSQAPTPAPSRKAGSTRSKPSQLPTRWSSRQRAAASQSTTFAPVLPITPKKRTYQSTASSPLSSLSPSDDESAECSSQGVIEKALTR
ncbi:hypothetical protein QFC19_000784 [Naganishia cerealis]|uniref:Uncharacterized protein n=1 Tax=Naganishia cerealis TaxID=610337 RepID=A0ACC2WMI3_9TREE|nr:hypothetical protein QFC19_000784 [Naganishia cerealis]